MTLIFMCLPRKEQMTLLPELPFAPTSGKNKSLDETDKTLFMAECHEVGTQQTSSMRDSHKTSHQARPQDTLQIPKRTPRLQKAISCPAFMVQSHSQERRALLDDNSILYFADLTSRGN